ncbi:MAG: phosphoenolpyruvate--protein phosphotransferase [Verrucomicrobiota bacterium]|jgi:fructose-specific PTS system IIA-like component
MPLKHHFVCSLPNGVHARPASSLEEASRGFASEVILLNQRTGRTANAKSVLAIIGADIRYQDPCVLTVSGPDEQEAIAAMTAFVDDTLPHCDDALPSSPATNGAARLPPGLREAGVTVHHGSPVVPGIASGRIVQMGGFKVPASLAANAAANPEIEWRKLDDALQKVIASYDRQIAAAGRKIVAGLLKAHRSIARDVEFHQQLHDAVFKNLRTAAGAIAAAEEHFSAMLAKSSSALLRERVPDIQDVCLQLLREAYGSAVVAMDTRLDGDSIIVADSLTPGQFLALNRNALKGLVLARADSTSHTVILARSFGIPTLAGLHDLANTRLNGQEAVLDADAGILLTNLTDAARRYYAMEHKRLVERQSRLRQFAARPAATRDGHRLEIAANIVAADEAAAVFAAGAEGIGVFRTEMLFLGRDAAPGETEQFEAYRRVLEAAGDCPVIIRTLDIGGDKALKFLNLPDEDNPFLGCRGARLYSKMEPLFRTQLRALIRASAHGRLKLMIPMVTTVVEARWLKKIVAEEQARCAAAGTAFDAAMPVGAMIEVPAAAFAMDALAGELDFFSIGSNDLLQYFMAADRTNGRVAGLYNPIEPPFLRLLKLVVDGAHRHKKWIGLCGEMGGQSQYLPLLGGLGLDEISAASPAIGGLKAELAEMTLPACRQLLDAAMNCTTAGEVSALLAQFAVYHVMQLLDPELVMLDVDAATKEEVVRQAVNRLYVLGRTEEPRRVEEAVWARETAYSTGFGHGFAIPHCKTDTVKFNSLAVLKLRRPVVWGSLDGQPVRVVILLTIRETNSATEHMKIFARLARRVMDEHFRQELEEEMDATGLCAFLRKSLQV